MDRDLGATALKPGEYRWFGGAEDARPGEIAILVSLTDQRAYVYQSGALIGASSVSTGQPGYDTPAGEYTILQKQVFHRSNLYDDAPMPYMQRLTWDGIALHAGHVPDYPASHGCIRLPEGFAKQLYGLTQLGARVSVVDASIDDPSAGSLAPTTSFAQAETTSPGAAD